MSFAPTLCLVLLAVYGLASLILSAALAIAWHAGLERALATSGDLLALRLLPAGGAALLVLTAALPAFLIYEPAHEAEHVGPLLVVLALFALVAVGDGIRRAWRACSAARLLIDNWGPTHSWLVESGQKVDVVDLEEPIVAVVGGWRPRILAARRVVAACSPEEFRRVIAHEAAHVSARDNLKLLLLVATPDALAWMPLGAALAKRWRTAAEFAADERATGPDPHKRVALASALIKVARLSTANDRTLPALSMSVGVDDVAGRVRRLLAPSPDEFAASPDVCAAFPNAMRTRTAHAMGTAIAHAMRTTTAKMLTACALLLPVIAVPLYGPVHEFIEVLVAFGR
jgi:hypothetical protein